MKLEPMPRDREPGGWSAVTCLQTYTVIWLTVLTNNCCRMTLALPSTSMPIGQGAGNTQAGYFDNWHQMLSEQIGVLESSSRKEGARKYKEELADDVSKGTARAFRLLRPLVAPPSGKVKVGSSWVYSPVAVLAEHRAIWAKW